MRTRYLLALACLALSACSIPAPKRNPSSASAPQIENAQAALDLLFSELPYIELQGCQYAKGAPSIGEDHLCTRKGVAEIYAWSAGFDEDCRGERAEKLLEELGRKVEARAAARAEALALWESASPEAQSAAQSAAREEFASFTQKNDWFASDRHIEALRTYVRGSKLFSRQELALLYEYFQNSYWKLNTVLRQGGRGEQCLRPLTGALVSALKRLPVHQGVVWRGLSLPTAVLEQYQKGNEVMWPAFSSTSLTREVAESFAKPKGGQAAVLFKIRSKSCVDARGASDKLSEEEVLCLPGTRVRIESRENSPLIEVVEQ